MSDIPIARSGARLERAKAAMIMLHGRGATAESILSMADGLGHPEIAYIAPQAPGFTWYPHSFLTPIERNEPALSQALPRSAIWLPSSFKHRCPQPASC